MAEREQEWQQRVTELEIKLGFAEDQLDALNLTVFRQQQELDRLLLMVQQLRQQILEVGQGGDRGSLREEIPPHY